MASVLRTFLPSAKEKGWQHNQDECLRFYFSLYSFTFKQVLNVPGLHMPHCSMKHAAPASSRQLLVCTRTGTPAHMSLVVANSFCFKAKKACKKALKINVIALGLRGKVLVVGGLQGWLL